MDRKLSSEFGCLGGWLAAALVMLAATRTYLQSPWAATQAAGPVGAAVATLNGMATARGTSTDAWFEWGTDTSYGLVSTLTNIGSSGKVVRVSASVGGLTAGATYHYRLVGELRGEHFVAGKTRPFQGRLCLAAVTQGSSFLATLG